MSGTPTSLLSLRLGWDRRAREATMTDLVDTTEMYLRTILDLEEEGIVPLRARISERLGHSGPTVSQTIGRMERDGLVVVEGDRHLVLTVEGRRRALHVMRKHRLAERLDRKSTRLNSSHVKISYAVFCLKKKTK